MAKRYAAIIIPMPAVQRLGRLRPALRRLPLAITRKIGPRIELCELNRHAAKHGIRLGMSLPQSRATHAALKVLEETPSDDALWIEKIARWAQGYGPWVSVYTRDAIVVEVSGSAHLFDSEAALIGHIKRGLAKLGAVAWVAIADSPRAAHTIAKATRGVAICPSGATASCLRDLPLEALSISAGLIEELHALGLTTIGALLSIPLASLDMRFDQELTLHLRQALGITPEMPTRLAPIERVIETMLFDPPFSDGQSLFFVAKRLCDALSERLQASALGARKLTMTIKHLVGPETLVEVDAAEALDRASALTLLINTKLEGVKLVHPVEEVSLEAHRREAVQKRLSTFFDKRRHRSHEAFASLVSRLEARLGRGALLGAHMTEDHRPERAWLAQPLVDATPSKEAHEASKIRPLRLFPTPEFARVLSEAGRPKVVNGSAVETCEGPERIRTGWWDGAPVARDYYRVQLTCGEWLWLALDLQTREFALCGVFA